MKGFRETAEDEIQNCLVRTQRRPSVHSFLIQGSNTLCLVYLPMFNVGNHKRQLIVTGTLSGDAMQKYTAAKDQDKNAVFTMHTKSTTLGDLKTLDQILTDAKFFGDIYVGLPHIYDSSPLLKGIEFVITSVRVNQSLNRQSLLAYPSEMPFYLYGSSGEYHIDHVLRSTPNAQLSATGVALRDVTPPLSDSKNYTLTFDEQIEWAMQPFTTHHPPAFFTPGSTFTVTIREEGYSTGTPISTGTITLSPNVGDIFVDYEHLNEEIAADVYIMVRQDSTKPDDQIKVDIDNISGQLVSLFDTEKITWLDNVPHSLRLNCSVAKEYSVTLGVPDASTIKDGAYFVVVSRFIGKQPTNTEALRFAQHKAWVAKFERGAPAQKSE